LSRIIFWVNPDSPQANETSSKPTSSLHLYSKLVKVMALLKYVLGGKPIHRRFVRRRRSSCEKTKENPNGQRFSASANPACKSSGM